LKLLTEEELKDPIMLKAIRKLLINTMCIESYRSYGLFFSIEVVRRNFEAELDGSYTIEELGELRDKVVDYITHETHPGTGLERITRMFRKLNLPNFDPKAGNEGYVFG